MADFSVQPREHYWYAFDFSDGCTNILDPETPDTLLSYTLHAYLDGEDVTATVLGRADKDGPGVTDSHGNGQLDTWHLQSGYYVFFLAYGGGEDETNYAWECIGESSSGMTIDLDATMRVKEL